MNAVLLSRDEFRERCFARDAHRCVVCGAQAVDAHHLIERKLWPDGGYYQDNAVSLCSACHIQAETTELSVEELRAAAGISQTLLPPGMDPAQPVDKWGNPVLADGRRVPGPMYDIKLISPRLRERFGIWWAQVEPEQMPWFGQAD